MRDENSNIGGDYNQSRVTLRKGKQPINHAVTEMYLYAGAAGAYTQKYEEKALTNQERIWRDLIKR